MSLEAYTEVWKHSKQSGGFLNVLLALADYAHDDGTEAHPSLATLAKKARMGERNARYCLRKLEDDGEIEATGKTSRGVTIYRVNLGKMRRESASQDGEAIIAPLQNEAFDPGNQLHQTPAAHCTQTVIESNVSNDTYSASSSVGIGSVTPPPEPAPIVTPFVMLSQVAESLGQDLRLADKGTIQRWCSVTKRMLANGVSVGEACDCAQYLATQDWRTSPVDVHAIEKNISQWRMDGSPGIAAKSNRYVSKSEMNSGARREFVY
jgi:hypothetical protein